MSEWAQAIGIATILVAYVLTATMLMSSRGDNAFKIGMLMLVVPFGLLVFSFLVGVIHHVIVLAK
jgi:hypothetical protein